MAEGKGKERKVMAREIKAKFETLYIRPEALKKIHYYTEAADGEVSGLGTVIKNDKGEYLIDKVFLLEQESSSGDTELDPEAISKLMTNMVKEKEDPGKLKFWWHSHANMGVFWSGTDDECAETLSKEYAFSLVVNKDKQLRCRLDLYAPFRITFDGVRVRELISDDPKMKAECKKEVEEKVREPKFAYSRCNYGVYDSRSEYDRKPDLKEYIVEDIEKLMDVAKDNADMGGIFHWDTWEKYVADSIRRYAEERYEKNATCQSFGTYDEDTAGCKHCKVRKACQLWTVVWEKEFLDDVDNAVASYEEKK